jgi:hypothetical protein
MYGQRRGLIRGRFPLQSSFADREDRRELEASESHEEKW